MSYTLDFPIQYIANPDRFATIGLGKLYIGVVDGDPAFDPADRIQVYIARQNDTDLAIPQPINLTAGGVPTYLGSPVTLKINQSFSCAVLDRNNQQVYYSPKSAEIIDELSNLENLINEFSDNALFVIENVAALSTFTPVAGQVYCLKEYHAGTGMGGGDLLAYSGTDTPNGGTIFACAALGVRLRRISYADLTFEMFGAKGDGITNDTSAIIQAVAATPSGGTLRGRATFYRINQTIVFPKTINLHFGGKENSGFLVDPAGTYLGSPYTAALYFPFATSNTPSVGNAIRSVASGFTVQPDGVSPPNMHGILNSCPMYFKEVDANWMSGSGFATIAGNGSPIPGNANGTTWENCGTYQNGVHGWYILGDDANQCTHYRSVGAGNGQYGFYDDGLLGNTYVGCEVIANGVGGYYCTSAKPNRSAYFNCYAESQIGAILWNISDRCFRFGNTGDIPGTTTQLNTAGAGFTPVPAATPYIFSSRQLAWGEDATYPGGETGGAWAKFGHQGLAYQPRAGAKVLRLKDIAANGFGWYLGTDLLIQFNNIDIVDNVKSNSPHFPNGLSLFDGKSAFVGAGTSPPTTGTYARGAIWLNTAPSAGGFGAWSCVASGTPGTWKTMWPISA